MNRQALSLTVFAAAAGLAAIAPLIWGNVSTSAGDTGGAFPGWPQSYEGRTLTAMPMSDREAAFARDFPGRTGRFYDGRREVIVRYVTAATRRLHPAADCLRGAGYAITPLPARREASGGLTSCLKAARGPHTMTVCETIRAADDGGAQWPDVASWYWAATMTGAKGPWWSFVVSENTGSASQPQ